MTRMTRRIAGASAFAFLFVASIAAAQQPDAVRVRGTIESVNGQMLTVKTREGQTYNIKVADNGPVRNVVKASLSDIKPGSYLATTAMPQPDGSQKAVAILVFPPGPHPGDVFAGWDFMPKSTMTNATVDTSVASVEGQKLVVKYKDGEKTILVPSNAEITTYAPGTIADAKPGKKIFIFAAKKLPDGTLEAPNVAVGDYGVWR